jgi:hypothetical protein
MMFIRAPQQQPAHNARPGAGLPNHVDPKDWKLMAAGTSQLIDDIDVDIALEDFASSNWLRSDDAPPQEA